MSIEAGEELQRRPHGRPSEDEEEQEVDDDTLRALATHARRRWLDLVLSKVKVLAPKKSEFTTDDVWALLEADGAGASMRVIDGRLMGAALLEAKKLRIVVLTDRVKKSVRRECHSRPIAVWRSVVYRARQSQKQKKQKKEKNR